MTSYRVAERLPWHAGQHSTPLDEFDPPDGCLCDWYTDGSLAVRVGSCPIHGQSQR